MASKRKPKAKLPAPVEAWAIASRDGPLWEFEDQPNGGWVVCGSKRWASRRTLMYRGDSMIRVRIVPIARKRRRVGK